jgi:hypothetical protein
MRSMRTSRKKRFHLGICLYAAIFSAWPNSAEAWTYREHFSITYWSLQTACAAVDRDLKASVLSDDEVREATNTLRALCSPHTAQCLAHMAAIAGDYTVDYLDLADPKHHKHYLKDPSLDCRDIDDDINKCLQSAGHTCGAEKIAPTNMMKDTDRTASGSVAGEMSLCGPTASNQVPPNLVTGSLFRRFMQARLAMSNGQHFQPASAEAWRLAEELLDPSATPNPRYESFLARHSYQLKFAQHAFALHFLEDSFPAGHVGIERSPATNPYKVWQWGFRQDYAQAYHDDMNAIGRFFTNKYESHLLNADVDGAAALRRYWFSFGDGRLCSPTHYLYVTPESLGVKAGDRVSKAAADSLIQRVISELLVDQPSISPLRAKNLDTELSMVLTDLVASKVKPTTSLQVLSLERRMGWRMLLRPCYWADYCPKESVLLTNDPVVLETCAPRGNASSEGGAGSLRPGLYDCFESKEHVFRAATALQEAFLHRILGLGDVEKLRSEAQSAVPILFKQLDVEDNKGWGSVKSEDILIKYTDDDISTKEIAPAPLHTTTIGLGISSVFGGPTDWKKSELKLIYTPDLFRKAGITESQIGLVEKVADRYNAFESVSGNFLWTMYRPRAGSLANASAIVTMGAERIWDGPAARNIYAGAGLGTSLELGRYIVEVRATRDLHWSSKLGTNQDWVLGVDVKIPSLNLFNPNN